MSIDERELRSRLEQAAALADPPRFTTDLAGQVRKIRRQRRRRATIAGAICSAAVASAVAIPLSVGAAGPASTPGTERHPADIGGAQSHPAGARSAPLAPPATGPRLLYTVTINGQTQADGRTSGTEPLFAIAPGSKLTMTVTVTVPGRHPITELWLGIINGAETGTHANMKPVLAASTRAPLQPGEHRFVLDWNVPASLRPGATRQLAAGWTWSRPVQAESQTAIADFAVPLPPGAMTRAAVAARLRAAVLHDVANCDGTKPAWIRAVRTTFGKAMTFSGVSQGDTITESATSPVYLVLMKGDFIFNEGQLPHAFASVCAHMAGHYFLAMFDARTFVNFVTGVSRHQFGVPLQTLGPVLNITR